MKTLFLAAALLVGAGSALAGEWKESAQPLTPVEMAATQGKFNLDAFTPVSNAAYLASVFGGQPVTVINTTSGPIYTASQPGDSTYTINFVVKK